MYGKIARVFKKDPNRKPRNYNPNPPYIPNENKYNDIPQTIEPHLAEMVNLVASWLSVFNGTVVRQNNGVRMTTSGEFSKDTLDFMYSLEAKFDAKTRVMLVTGYIKCFDMYLLERGRTVNIRQGTAEGIYTTLNSLYQETAYNIKK